MAKYKAITDSPHERYPNTKLGILLTNLGTPDAPTAPALRTYLRQFLSDPRVIEIPKVIWRCILYAFILPFRPKKSAKLYQSIWTPKGSPLLVNCQNIVQKLTKRFTDQPDLFVDIGMRYGNPGIPKVLQKMQAQGVQELVVLPLYPQYSGSTTGSTFDELSNELRKWRWVPKLHFLTSYHDHPLYIKALVESIQRHVEQHGMPEKLLLSYHGTPRLFLDRGDPYHCHCFKTSRLVREQLQWPEAQIITCFQSRFGKAEWLKPYTSETLTELGEQGVKHLAIMSPAFSVDCLETLEELIEENREVFEEAGGQTYHYIPALNDNDAHIDLIETLLSPYLPHQP